MNPIASIEIHLNGEPAEVPADATVATLVTARGLEPKQVAVEVNKLIVPRAQHAEARLVAGDRVEIVTLVGGG